MRGMNGGTILAALPMDECLSMGGRAAVWHQPAAVSVFLFFSHLLILENNGGGVFKFKV